MADDDETLNRAGASEPGVRHSQSYKLQQLKILEGLASGTARPSMEDFKAQMAGAGASAAAQEAANLAFKAQLDAEREARLAAGGNKAKNAVISDDEEEGRVATGGARRRKVSSSSESVDGRDSRHKNSHRRRRHSRNHSRSRSRSRSCSRSRSRSRSHKRSRSRSRSSERHRRHRRRSHKRSHRSRSRSRDRAPRRYRGSSRDGRGIGGEVDRRRSGHSYADTATEESKRVGGHTGDRGRTDRDHDHRRD